jgi:ubiquinone/menaquinone biosynthesis C-methylase UbiE
MNKMDDRVNCDKRYEQEEDFHDNKYTNEDSDPGHYALNPTYEIFLRMIDSLKDVKGKKILECGCGTGWITAELAALGAIVYAFDISNESIKATKKLLLENNLDKYCIIEKKTAEGMDYPDEIFDYVFGFAILHHVDLDKTIPQIYRVLKPSGTAIFAEPLESNLFLNLYRRFTPQYRTRDERPLNIHAFSTRLINFSKFTHDEFYLVTLLPLFLSNFKCFRITPKLIKYFHRFDQFLFKSLPFTKRWAWYSIFRFEK